MKAIDIDVHLAECVRHIGSSMSVKVFLRRSVAVWAPVVASFMLLLLADPAQSQVVVDGSDRAFDSSDRALLLSVLKSKLRDPKTARVRGIVQTKPGVYCGEVSTRGRDGEYGDFTRFVVETKIRQATITPTSDPARAAMILRMIEDRCRSLDGDSR